MMMGEGHVMKKAMFISEDGEVHDLMGDVDMDVMENMDVLKSSKATMEKLPSPSTA